MTYCFDLDGTLCTNTYGEYENATPFLDRITIVNKLYNEENKIIINTSRGFKTGLEWYDLTQKQLNDWGVKYHELYVGKKIDADIFVDDKSVSDIDFFKK